MIIVTGASGQLGRLVTEGLLSVLPADKIGISVRNPDDVDDFQRQGVKVFRGDFSEPISLAEAFDQAEQVLIISVNKFGDEAVRLHSNAIDAAKKAGVKRILYTSHQGANPASAFAACRENHARTEALLESSGLSFVSLRNGFYTESALLELGDMKQSGEILLPADGKVSWTARTDLAEAAVAAMIHTNLFDGFSPPPPLINSERLNFEDIATLASEILGSGVVRKVISDEEHTRAVMAQGFPEVMAAGFTSLYKAARAGEYDIQDPTLETIIGYKPTSFQDVLRDYLNNTRYKLFQGY